MGILKFKLNDGCKAMYEDIGVPFIIGGLQHDAYVNRGERVQGFKTLREICEQTEFTLLMRNRTEVNKAQINFMLDILKPIPHVSPYSRYVSDCLTLADTGA